MRIISDDLFRLIKSLTKSEKGYFKKYAAKHIVGEGNNYILLFDAINGQEKYDEEKIIKDFSNYEFVKNLSSGKPYLYNLILKSLRSFNRNISTEALLKNYLQHIEILFSKGLYDQCEKLIKKSKQIAAKYESHLQLMELFKWEFSLLNVSSYSSKSDGEIENIFSDLFLTLEKIKNEQVHNRQYIRSLKMAKKIGFIRNKKDQQNFESVLNNPLVAPQKKIQSYQAQNYNYLSKSSYYFFQTDFENAHIYCHKLITLMENNFHQVEEDPWAYISALKKLALCQKNLRRYNELKTTIKTLRELKTRSTSANANAISVANNLELGLYVMSGEYQKGISFLKQIENDKSNQDIVMNYYMALIYFGVNDYYTANTYLNNIINDTKNKQSDVYGISMILSLIVHYEMGTKDLLDYSVRSTYRFLYKRNRLYRFETALLEFMRKDMPQMTSPAQTISAYKRLKNKLKEILSDPYEANVMNYFDFISWLESKIENRSFVTIVQSKVLE
jgi:hypothetical protein